MDNIVEKERTSNFLFIVGQNAVHKTLEVINGSLSSMFRGILHPNSWMPSALAALAIARSAQLVSELP
jgi:hypothetical protein